MAMSKLLGLDASTRMGMQHRNLNSNKKKKTLFSGSGYDGESAISMLSSTTASTSSAAMNGEKKKKACNVIRLKVPKDFKLEDYNKESDAKTVTDSTCTTDSCCSSATMMNGDDGIRKKERIVVKINLAAWRQRKAQQQQMESSSSTQAINTCSEEQQQQQMESSSSTQAINTCSEKQETQKEEEGKEKGNSLELKLESSKRKLQLRYQQVQNAKRKIQLVDLRDMPKPEPEINFAKKSKYHR